MKVMIVDDSKMMRVMHARSLRQIGYEVEVIEAGSGEEALQHMSDDLDLVIVDWNMPGMDGIEFTQTVRARHTPGAKYVPFLMITSQSTEEQAVRAREAGIDKLLTKPVTPEAIGVALDMILARRA